MTMRMVLALLIASLTGCGVADRQVTSGGREAEAASWWRWHADKQQVDMAVSEAINEPGGGDYAKAVDITRASDRPDDVKQHQIGMLIIGGFDDPGSKRPPETLEQGLRMVEDSTTMAGEMRETTPQKLRMMFERGAGRAPNAIPVDSTIATCWLAVEEGRSDDPARCIALRRQRLPRVGV